MPKNLGDISVFIQSSDFEWLPHYFFFSEFSPFDELLLVSEKWKLDEFENYLQFSLLDKLSNDIEQFEGTMTIEFFKVLWLADKHEHSTHCRDLLKKTKKICSSLFNSSIFKEARPKLRYEIFKKRAVYEFKERGKDSIECFVIFNFLDLILYEDKVLDHFSTALYEEDEDPYLFIDRPKKTRMSAESEDNVTLEVEGHKILISPVMLAKNSPVFRAMLMNSNFQEGVNKVVKLPGKKFGEIKEFLGYITQPYPITGKH